MSIKNIKNVNDLKVGDVLQHTKTGNNIKIAAIEGDNVKLEGKEKYNTMGTIKRWYRLVETVEEEPQEKEEEPQAPEPDQHPHRKVIRNRKTNCNIVPLEEAALLRDDLLTYCRAIKVLEERARSRYNSFYLNKINLFEVMAGKRSFIIYFNDKCLTDDLKAGLYKDTKVRGNDRVLKVVDRDTFKLAKDIIKALTAKL